jgi:transmembrane protein TMEM260 (protein O-mannosyltransferase)
LRKAIAGLAVLFFAAHVPVLPPTLEDLDSINFALGVRSFDVAKHQPHPPGYPVFIAMGKASTGLLRSVGVASPEPRGLAIWSAIAGALLVVPLFMLFLALDASESRAWWATFVVALSPLFWFTALRPLSDASGLTSAVASQALALSVAAGRARPRALVWAALIAGLAVGIRSQTLLLTLPPLVLALMWPQSTLAARDRIAALAAAAIGVVAWAVPLVMASGGLSAYAAALGSQAGEDLSGVVMLWNQRHAGFGRIARVGADALAYSLVWPWANKVAAAIVLVVAAAGCVRLAWRLPRALAILAVTFVPYTIFHLLFHEVVTTRYALPLLIPVAFCLVQGVSLAGPRAVAPAACALAAWGLWISVPASASYGVTGSPTFRAFRDVLSSAGDDRSRPRIVAMHAVMRRAADWIDAGPGVQFVKATHGHEWLALVAAWRADPTALVSYVADPRRTDLALIDPASRRGPSRYTWSFSEPPFVGGARPGNADVYTMRPPGWMLDRGWALTAEVAGVTDKDGYGPHLKPSIAWIRAREGPATLMIGGRHLVDGASPVRIALVLNGDPVETFDAAPGYFFRRIELPGGALARPSPFVPLSVTSVPVDRSARPLATALEQFDVQSASVPMVGAESGWYEPEYNPRTAQAWRWTSEQAVLWVRPVGRDVRLTLSGESPLRYFDAPPAVIVRAGAREVARFSPSADFTESIVLPADALAVADGRVTISSDKMFVPAERRGAPDRRHLALRIYAYSVR